MIIASSRMIVRPAERSALLEAMRGILQPTRVERGCVSYRFYEDVENRNAFLLLEAWDTQQDLEVHIATDTQRRLLSLMDLLSEGPDVQFHTVSHTTGIDLIEDVFKKGGPE